MANVLVIDDDQVMCNILTYFIKRQNHKVSCALTLKDGVDLAKQEEHDVVFLDVIMPDGSGLDILPEIRSVAGSPEVIIMTASGSTDGAEIAIKNGAWDYIQKPLTEENVILSLKRVFQYRESLSKTQKPIIALKREGIIGNSPLMRNCLDTLAQAAATETNVLITGETGTGKELFAKAIHYNSKRAKNNFVVVDCASLPETLIESTLFGHVKGSFTGAEKNKDGLVLQANQGTLFLDEIGELSLPLQKSFLRVLQEKRFRPIGSAKEVESDFRLVAATNRNLDRMVDLGQFRQDLLFRLRASCVDLPPLRQRPDDIKELVFHYADKICKRYDTDAKGISSDFLDALYAYEWPGNVRELVNTLEGVIAEAQPEPVLFSKHLPTHIRVQVARAAVEEHNHSSTSVPPRPASVTAPETGLGEKPIAARAAVAMGISSFDDQSPTTYKEYRKSILSEADKKYLQHLIAFTQGSIKNACKISGLGRTRLYNLMKEHNISRYGWTSPDNSSS